MTTLHACFLHRDQQAFQRLLDPPRRSQSTSQGLSTSGGKSWNRPSPLSSLSAAPCDVNARDSLGRTVLHLAASAVDAAATEYVRMLLAHPYILVNMPDRESHWTALHRALYHGNLATALVLLQRSDIDVSLKDSEGYTAFDLYNSTVEGTKPATAEAAALRAELYTWGVNRNAALGQGDGDDRAFPDQVNIEPVQLCPDDAKVEERFAPIRVKQVAMSKLHTGVVTTEDRANFRVCGFGSGGRLGPGQHTQYRLSTISQLSQSISSVALGQDHTLALTTSGEVLSWGLNRFSQLGYVIEGQPGASTRLEEPIQPIPRKIGALRGKTVLGVAACKTASACWTDSEVYTWGTNHGQLGYDMNAHPVQIFPRVVTKITQPVLSVSITDNAMACLLGSHDVACIYNDGYFRVTFPAQAFPSEITAYRPPQAIRNTSIQKIVSCDNNFAALSSNGELFTFSLPTVPDSGANSGNSGKGKEHIKPQRVWALRKKFSSVKDVALGADGAIIICTESGHVFVRERTGGKTSKFQRVPYLQRIVKVSANNTGAYGALRVDAEPEDVMIAGNVLPQDFANIQPFFLPASPPSGQESTTSEQLPTVPPEDADGEQEDVAMVFQDQQQLIALCRLLLSHHEAQKSGVDDVAFSTRARISHGADTLIHVQSGAQPRIPAHRLVLAARSSVLADVLAGRRVVEHQFSNLDSMATLRANVVKQQGQARPIDDPHLAPWKNPINMTISGCHGITVLILLVYFYTDQLLSPWDWRIANSLKVLTPHLSVLPVRIKVELQACAQAFELPILATALQMAFKRQIPFSLIEHIKRLCPGLSNNIVPATAGSQDPLAGDVILLLLDKKVACHSVVLRARSPFFKSFFDEEAWTLNRWTADGTILVDLQHLRWREMRFVMQYLYGGDMEIFDRLEFIKTIDELLELMFDIMAVANELLLDRLSLLCSAVILRRLTILNTGYVLTDATHFNSPSLVQSAQSYIAQNLETFLESRMLDDLPIDLIRQLSLFVRSKQTEKNPVLRSNRLVDVAYAKHKDWLLGQDIPEPIVHVQPIPDRGTAKPSPPGSMRKQKSQATLQSPDTSPSIRPRVSSEQDVKSMGMDTHDDDLFVMDTMDRIPRLNLAPKQDGYPEQKPSAPAVSKPSPGWKVSSVPRVDMKSIMAEAQTTAKTTSTRASPRAAPTLAGSSNWRSGSRPSPAPESATRHPSSTPWKSIPATSVANLANTNPSPAQTPPMTPLLRPTRVKDERPNPSVSGQSTVPAPRPGMGPVYSPSKQSSAKNTSSPAIRRASSSASAWTSPPVQPVAQSASTAPSMSFAEIQQLQLEQNVTPKKDKRSLKEIQDEEKARQVEEDFLRWWSAEEERLRVEQLAAEAAKGSSRNSKARKSKRKVDPRGEGSSNAQSGGKEGQPRPEKRKGDRKASSSKTKQNMPEQATVSTGN